MQKTKTASSINEIQADKFLKTQNIFEHKLQ